MKLSQKDLYFLSQCATSAALQAADIITHYTDKSFSHHLKKGVGSLAAKIVTEVDFLAQEKILQALLQSCQMYDLAILTEESEDDLSRLDKDYFWCIDPLDGTIYFSESEPGYAISIALVSKSGESMLGIIYDPYEKKLYTSIKGKNSFINQLPINRVSTDNKGIVTILCDRHFLQHKVYNQYIDKLTQLLTKEGYHSTKIRANGGAVKNAMGVLEHSPACYFKLPKEQLGGGCLWDYAASSSFFYEADAIVTDMAGNKLDLNPPSSLYMNHCGVVFASNQKIADCIYQLAQRSC